MNQPATAEAGKNTGRAKKVTVGIIIAAVIVGAAVVAFARPDLFSALGFNFIRLNDKNPAESFMYDAGAGQIFALAGNGLAVATVNGATLIDAGGKSVTATALSVESPAIASCGTRCAFYDTGGNTLRVADFKGNITVMDTRNTLISVTMNESGWMAVTEEEPGYKGIVTVYDAKLKPVYEWYSGSGYVIKAVVSPDCKEMAALCATSKGGRVAVFALSDEKEKSSFSAPDELLLDLCYVKNGLLCSVSERRTVFIDSNGDPTGSFDFGNLLLTEYEFGADDFVAIFLSRYRSGNDGTLITIDFDAAVIGRLETSSDLLSISAKGNRLAVLMSDGLELFSNDLVLLAVLEDVSGIKKALLRSKNEALLLSAYQAAAYGFSF